MALTPVPVMPVRLVAPVTVKLPPVLLPNCRPVEAPVTVIEPAVTAALEFTMRKPAAVALVALVFVLSFAVLVVLPPVLLALALRVFAAPTHSREMGCRPASNFPAIAAWR